MGIIKGFKEGESVPKGAKFICLESHLGELYFDRQMNDKRDTINTFYYEVFDEHTQKLADTLIIEPLNSSSPSIPGFTNGYSAQ